MITEQTEEVLNQKIRELRSENDEIKERLESYEAFARFKWIAQSEMPNDRGLPTPRLEIEWTHDGFEDIALYRMVVKRTFRFGQPEIWSFPLGRTTCTGRRPWDTDRVFDGLDLPLRDGLHIRLDMASLKMPGYMIRGETVIKLTPENDPYLKAP